MKALVLSAGGMFGAYQAGVWSVLGSSFQPDLVIGASVGSLNGWAIAGGAGPDDILHIWRDAQMTEFSRARLNARFWNSLFDTRALEKRIRELWAAYRPQTGIGVVAVDLLHLRPKVFWDGEIGWQHLAASCAILLAYPQVRIGGRLYTDGGLLRVLPVWPALKAGATKIVAVNVLPEMPSHAVRMFVSGVRAIAPKLPAIPTGNGVRIVTIKPEASLGTVREALFWKRESIERWIEAGRKDAERALAGGLLSS